MERRMEKRVKTRYFAKICGKAGMLNDISSGGLHVTTNALPQKKKVEICFDYNGRTITVNGWVRWYRKRTYSKPMNHMGIIIKQPTAEFQEFVSGFQ